MIRLVTGLSAALLLGCSAYEVSDLTSPCAELPADSPGLAAFVEAGCHQAWPGEPAVHKAEMAPGGARVFHHPTLHRSLLADATVHPVGSAAVREIYREDLTTLLGWAIAVKVDDDSGDGHGWLWVEHWVEAGTTVDQRGASGCTGCHAGATDFVQSSAKAP